MADAHGRPGAGVTSSHETSAAADGAWELWRQDDNGNRFRIGRFATEARADAEQRRFEALAHKQIYWVERREDGGGDEDGGMHRDGRAGCDVE